MKRFAMWTVAVGGLMLVGSLCVLFFPHIGIKHTENSDIFFTLVFVLGLGLTVVGLWWWFLGYLSNKAERKLEEFKKNRTAK